MPRATWTGALTVGSCLLAWPAASAQPTDLPLSKTVYAAAVEMLSESLRRPGDNPYSVPELSPPMLTSLDRLAAREWHVTCSRDDLTGKTESCWLQSPDYLPADWTLKSTDCWSALQGLRRTGLSDGELFAELLSSCTTGLVLDAFHVSVWCGGRVTPHPLFTVSRFMVGDDVITLDGEETMPTLFTSPDGSWASKETFGIEATKSRELVKQVFRFVPDGSAVREFLAGPECSDQE